MKLKLSPNEKFVLIISLCFILFALSIYINHAFAEVSVSREELDSIKATKSVIENNLTVLGKELDAHYPLIIEAEKAVSVAEDAETIAKYNYKKAIAGTLEARRLEVVDAMNNLLTAHINLETAKNNKQITFDRIGTENKKLAETIRTLNEKERAFDIEKKSSFKGGELTNAGQVQTKFIGIILSDACKKSPKCPNYKELAKIYDNSNKFISGDFILDNRTVSTVGVYGYENNVYKKISDKPIEVWKRDKPFYKDHQINWYKRNNNAVITFVDPDEETRRQAKLIYLEPSLPIGFNLPTGMRDNTIVYEKDRKIDGCSRATIGFTNHGHELLADTWSFFYHNCEVGLKMGDPVQVIQKQKTKFKYCSDEWCKYLKWLNDAKERSKTKILIGNDTDRKK